MRNWLTLLWILRSTLVCKLENQGSQLVSHWGQKRRCPCSTTMQKRDSTCNFIIKRISSPSEDGNQAIFQYDPLCCLQLHVNPPPEEETPLGWHCSLQASSLVMVVLCGVTQTFITEESEPLVVLPGSSVVHFHWLYSHQAVVLRSPWSIFWMYSSIPPLCSSSPVSHQDQSPQPIHQFPLFRNVRNPV